MQSAGGLECIKSRTEIKMISIAQNYLCLNIFLEISMVYALH